MRDPNDDAELVQAARRGEKAAFATLLDRHRAVLIALCRRTLGDASFAEDAAQEAALQAMLSLDRLREPPLFGSWLAGIGLNVCRRWLRYRSRECWSWEALQGGGQIAEPADTGPSPEELAEAADIAGRVRRAVADLPAGQRAVVLLFYLSGLTHAETAAQLGIEIGAVKTRLHKARQTLRRKLWILWKEEEMATQATTQPLEVRVLDVRRVPNDEGKSPRHLVVLEEVGGTRRLPIWVGQAEAEAMAMQIERVQPPRPITYAFAASLLRAAGARLREVRLTRLTDTVFYAIAEVEGAQGTVAVDARPSDALNLAVMVGVPIRVEPAVLEASDAFLAAQSSAVLDYLAEGTIGAREIAAEITSGWSTQGVPPTTQP